MAGALLDLQKARISPDAAFSVLDRPRVCRRRSNNLAHTARPGLWSDQVE
jgi:hypothetical protein